MTPRPLVRYPVLVALALAATLLAAPSAAAPGPPKGGALAGPTNLRVVAVAPHSVALAWDAAVNSGSFTYVIEASFGYRVGVHQSETSYIWTRDLTPGRTYSFVMWAGDAKGRESKKSNTVTVTLPVDTTPPAAPAVTVTGTTSSTVGLTWGPVADDDFTCCTYRVYANGVLATPDLQWEGERSVTVLRLAAATTHSFTVVAVDRSRNESAPSAPVTATTAPSTDTTGPTAPGSLFADNMDGCETWLYWTKSVDDQDPQEWLLYEVHVNGVFDGAQRDISRWITYGTAATNTYTVQAIDSSGNRSPVSSVTLHDQTC